MNLASGRKKILVLAISFAIIAANGHSSSAKQQKEEEKPFTQAQSLSPGGLKTLESRTYDEGVTVKKIEIEGNNLVKTSDIMQKLTTKEGSVFDREAVQNDLKSIYEMGYFTERLKAIPISSSSGITLKIRVEENVPVTGFTITGNKVVPTEEIAKILNPQTGLPQNISELNKAVQEIEDLYAQKGYILARVKRIEDDPDGMINVEINEGIIDEIRITGNTRTKDYVIKRNILTQPGTVYNENILKQDLSRIYGTQAFSDVRRVLSASNKDPDKYLLTVEVDEKRTGSISIGGGVDTGSGLFGSLGFVDHNLRGRGQELSITAMTGTGIILDDRDTVERASFQFEAKFVEPRLKQTLNSLQVRAFGNELASYQVPLGVERRIGSEIQLARPFKKYPHLAGSVSFGVEDVTIKEGDWSRISKVFAQKGIDISRRADQLVGGTFITLGPSLIYDTRNSIYNTTQGFYSSIGYEHSFAVGGDSDSFGKVSATIRRFFPVGQRSTFTVGGRVAATAIGDLPEFAGFRLGGSSTIRGFREGDVGNGGGYMMASAELRTPIPFMDKVTNIKFFNDMRTAFFVDAGTLFNETLTNQLYNRPGYGISVGAGLRIFVPGIGPINLDYGIPITNVGAGNKKGGRFTFGFGDLY